MNNFLYCFDKKYNSQAFVSMISLLENVSEKINIIVIHQFLDVLKVPDKIKKHSNLNKIIVYEFPKKNLKFPNVIGTHVSEATYYRFFISEVIKENFEYLIYLDSDIVCNSDPIKNIDNSINELEKSKFIISARDEIETKHEKLRLKNMRYFNAGVLIINFTKWKQNNCLDNLVDILNERESDLLFWDQDALNILFDGDYVSLPATLNYNLKMIPFEKNLKNTDYFLDINFIHYFGKFKPWSLRGILNLKTEKYHQYYRLLFYSKYHLQDSWKVNTIKTLLMSILNLSIFNVRFPISLFTIILKFLFIGYKDKLNEDY